MSLLKCSSVEDMSETSSQAISSFDRIIWYTYILTQAKVLFNFAPASECFPWLDTSSESELNLHFIDSTLHHVTMPILLRVLTEEHF